VTKKSLESCLKSETVSLNEGLVALEDWKIKAAELTVKKS
jgi:hypothetical protein